MQAKTFLYILLIFVVLSHPTETFQYAYQGLTQWATKMVPTLFPFMMISSIMIYSGADIELGNILSIPLKKMYCYSKYGIYAIFMGFLCGFPMGAKVVCELYDNHKISKSEAISLIKFCNNIGPAYFLGIIFPILDEYGYHNKIPFIFGMYGIPALYGIVLSHLQSHTLNVENQQKISYNKPSSECQLSFSALFKKSCIENTQSLILLGGYITFINALRILICFIPISPNLQSVFSAFLEIMGGVQTIYVTNLNYEIKIFWIMVALCFGGISCILQTSCFLEKVNIPLIHYIKHKIIMTVITSIYYALLLLH